MVSQNCIYFFIQIPPTVAIAALFSFSGISEKADFLATYLY